MVPLRAVKHAWTQPFLGMVSVGYVIAVAVSQTDTMALADVSVLVAAAICGVLPFWLRRLDGCARVRVGWLMTMGGLVLASGLVKSDSLAVEVSRLVVWSGFGALVLDLALSVPLTHLPKRRLTALRMLNVGAAALASGVGLLASWPALVVGDEVWLLSVEWLAMPQSYALGCLVLSTAIRSWRARLAGSPSDVSANYRALLGLWICSLIVLPLSVWGWLSSQAMLPPGGEPAFGLAMLALVGAHAFLVESRPREAIDVWVRRSFAVALTLALAACSAAVANPYLPDALPSFVVLTTLWLLAHLAIYLAINAVAQQWLRPFRGRLLDAIADVEHRLARCTSLQGLAELLLGAMRQASGHLQAQPRLFAFESGHECRVDSAGIGSVEERGAPHALKEAILSRPDEILVRALLQSVRVRRPELRDLAQTLVDLDALCAIPLTHEGVVEGVLVIPRGDRRAPVSVEETTSLRRLADSVASLLHVLASQHADHLRYRQERVAREALQDQFEQIKSQLEQWRQSSRVLQRHRGMQELEWPLVALSDEMKEMRRRLELFAPLDVPVMVHAPSQREALTVAYAVHNSSRVASGPFVVADCAALRPEQARSMLFGGVDGDCGELAWFALARGGTLVLQDVVALPISLQQELAECIAERKDPGRKLLELRIIVTSRESLETLIRDERIASGLAQRLKSQLLEIPPLSVRQPDLPSLAYAAVDRAVRRLGRHEIGLHDDALERLLVHTWPGDLDELDVVITNAVRAAQGDAVTVGDLAFYGDAVAELSELEPYSGTYAALEQQILKTAIERAGGNKSEAARALGLKRTTFIDKLRRFQLDDSETERAGENAA
jgi:DNA-binding NtrC family response regulator